MTAPSLAYQDAMNGIAILYDALSDAENELNKLKNQWIKCSDRLPPVNEDGESCSLLLYGMETQDSYFPHQFIGFIMDGKFYCDTWCSPHQCYNVTHWQPLPPPPEDK